MSAAATLPRRPEIYRSTDDLPCGVLAPLELANGQWTVVRTVNLLRWFPLTSRDNPAWLLWPRRDGAVGFVNNGCRCFGQDWPHWGTGDLTGAAW